MANDFGAIVKDKLSNLKVSDSADESGDADSLKMELLPRSIGRRISALEILQEKHDTIFEEYKKARCELELNFRNRYAELYHRRYEIVTGIRDAELAPEELNESENVPDESENITGIPEFWMQAMLRHEALEDLVEQHDFDLLRHITDIRCIDRDDMLGFRLEFHFSPNDYFTDSILQKSYTTFNMLDQGAPLLQKVSGCEIHWKHGMNLCEKTLKPKQGKRGGRHNNRQQKAKTVKTDSFFKFFLDPLMLDSDDEEDDVEQYELNYDVDYEVALIFRNYIIPKAVQWYTGEATNSDEDSDGEEKSSEQQENDNIDEQGDKNQIEESECKQS